ncbi:VIT1/CCC1 transporter family protein [Rhizobacter sp. LjRoot28]|uniref:VIT1/CCC1 transporter family protein n=1 Tax=Rhizobacter sp. LjRoot28 TaxID=3342309 RepID=UPI003ED05AB7
MSLDAPLPRRRHGERHRSDRGNALRAGVLGANDGLVSTASLVLGVAAATPDASAVLTAGVAGLVAGAMSMAAGEYVSVHSQADTQRADLERERAELDSNRPAEHRELAAIYEERGLTPALAAEVAEQLMQHDALGAHARDELGLSETSRAQPGPAALISASSFGAGAALPLLAVWAAPGDVLLPAVALSTLLFLALLGATAARLGGASALPGALRVTWWGAIAMGATAAVGALFGAVV